MPHQGRLKSRWLGFTVVQVIRSKWQPCTHFAEAEDAENKVREPCTLSDPPWR